MKSLFCNRSNRKLRVRTLSKSKSRFNDLIKAYLHQARFFSRHTLNKYSEFINHELYENFIKKLVQKIN